MALALSLLLNVALVGVIYALIGHLKKLGERSQWFEEHAIRTSDRSALAFGEVAEAVRLWVRVRRGS